MVTKKTTIKRKARIVPPAISVPPIPTPVPQTVEEILKDRGSKYGVFKTHAQITQNLKDIMGATPNWDILSADMKEALDMTAHKIGRILNGDPTHKDHWVDIQGYNKLVSDTLED